MTTKTMKYTLDNIITILFNGFEYKLPDETLDKISEIALQVGSPDYVKTPVFQKRDNPMKVEVVVKENMSGKDGEPGYRSLRLPHAKRALYHLS